jgi:hypothetical protein
MIATPADLKRRLARCVLVEGNLFIAIDAEDLLRSLGAENVVVANSGADASALLAVQTSNFALLDFSLSPEICLPVARCVQAHAIPFAFGTGSEKIYRWAMLACRHNQAVPPCLHSQTPDKLISPDALQAGSAKSKIRKIGDVDAALGTSGEGTAAGKRGVGVFGVRRRVGISLDQARTWNRSSRARLFASARLKEHRMETTLIAEFDTRREAELAVEHIVQEYGVPRGDVLVQPTGTANSSGQYSAGADVKAAPEPTEGAKLEGSIEVSVDFHGDDSKPIMDAMKSAGAKFVRQNEGRPA